MTMMHFLKELQEFLNKNSVIYTVRRFLYSRDDNVVYIPEVGGCIRELILEDVSKDDLEEYYPMSGFQTVDAWWEKIQVINKKNPKAKLYLYRVEKLR